MDSQNKDLYSELNNDSGDTLISNIEYKCRNTGQEFIENINMKKPTYNSMADYLKER